MNEPQQSRPQSPIPRSGSTGLARECAWRDSATVHMLGNLTNDESQAYVAHLSGCGACREELELAREVVARVDRSASSNAEMSSTDSQAQASGSADAVLAAPVLAAAVRQRLLDQIARTPQEAAPKLVRTWQSWRDDSRRASAEDASQSGFSCVDASDGEWQSITPKDSGLPEIDVKRLSLDAKRRYVTMLVRMAPGASYPSHRHAGNEECFVISGDIKVGERVLHAGDYQLAAENSIHGVQSTEHGCTLLIVSSQDDELIG